MVDLSEYLSPEGGMMYVVITPDIPDGMGFRTKQQAIRYARNYATASPKIKAEIWHVTANKIDLVGNVYGNPRNPNLLWVKDFLAPFGESPLPINGDGTVKNLWL